MELIWSSKIKKFTAPFTENGSLCSWEGDRHHEIRDVSQPFPALLSYMHYCKGRSAVNFYFVDEKGAVFPMFLSDFVDMVVGENMVERKVHGLWKVVKKGTNYGVQFISKI